MLRKGRVRLIALTGVGSIVAAGILAACSGDDSTPSTTTDGGGGSDSPSNGDVVKPPTDGGGGTDSGVVRGNAIALNNLMTKISPVRYCFAASAGDPGVGDVVDTAPQPADPAGLAPGFATRVDAPSALVGQNVKVFVYYVQSLDAFGLSGDSCQQLLALSYLTPETPDAGDAGDAGSAPPPSDGGTLLIQKVDFDVSTINGGLAASGRTFLFTAGCPQSSDSSKLALVTASGNDYCGASPGNSGVGDFHVYAFSPDATAAASTANNRVQGLELQPTFEYRFPGFGIEWYFTADYGDASVDLSGPVPNDLTADGGGPGGYQYQFDGGPLYPMPGQEMPNLATATSLNYNMDLGLSGQVDPAASLTFSGLKASDVTGGDAYTLVFMGSFMEPQTLTDGGPNPLAVGFRILSNH